MTLQEAYISAKTFASWHESAYLIEVRDFGESFGFCFSPYPPQIETGGGGYTLVNKNTAVVSDYMPHLDGFDLLGKGKPVPLKLLKDWIPPTAKTAKRRKPVAVAVAV